MIVVIGGTGFVGKNLTQTLHAAGQPLRVVSRRPDTGFLDTHAPQAEALTLETFLADPAAALFGCEAVVYLASTSTPGVNLDTPWRESCDTVEPATRVMTMVARHSKAHFVYLSSGGTVYGQCHDPMIGEDVPLNPISPYGLGKKMTEAAIAYMALNQGLRATILRPSNPIGQWQTSLSQGVVGALMRAARAGTPFPEIGDGCAVRDFFDVRDLVTAILGVLAAPEKSVGQTWNVGSGQGHSIREMRELVQEVTGQPITVEHHPARQSDVDRVVLDISRIRAAIGWEPEISLRVSLQDIWAAQKIPQN